VEVCKISTTTMESFDSLSDTYKTTGGHRSDRLDSIAMEGDKCVDQRDVQVRSNMSCGIGSADGFTASTVSGPRSHQKR
jgi:hypothetical protein